MQRYELYLSLYAFDYCQKNFKKRGTKINSNFMGCYVLLMNQYMDFAGYWASDPSWISGKTPISLMHIEWSWNIFKHSLGRQLCRSQSILLGILTSDFKSSLGLVYTVDIFHKHFENLGCNSIFKKKWIITISCEACQVCWELIVNNVELRLQIWWWVAFFSFLPPLLVFFLSLSSSPLSLSNPSPSVLLLSTPFSFQPLFLTKSRLKIALD